MGGVWPLPQQGDRKASYGAGCTGSIFSDTLQVRGCMGVDESEGEISMIYGAYRLAQFLPPQQFAGIVCVADLARLACECALETKLKNCM